MSEGKDREREREEPFLFRVGTVVSILGTLLGGFLPAGASVATKIASFVGKEIQENEHIKFQERMSVIAEFGSTEELSDVAREIARTLADRYKEQILRLVHPQPVKTDCCSGCPSREKPTSKEKNWRRFCPDNGATLLHIPVGHPINSNVVTSDWRTHEFYHRSDIQVEEDRETKPSRTPFNHYGDRRKNVMSSPKLIRKIVRNNAIANIDSSPPHSIGHHHFGYFVFIDYPLLRVRRCQTADTNVEPDPRRGTDPSPKEKCLRVTDIFSWNDCAEEGWWIC